MIVTKPGVYKFVERCKLRGPISVLWFCKDTCVHVTQVDADNRKVIAIEFPDWQYWDLPVVEVEE